MANKSKEGAGDMGTAGDKMTKAQQAGSEAVGKAKEAVQSVNAAATEAVDAGASALGGRMTSLAGTIREQAPREGMIGGAASAVAEGLEQTGRYIQKEGVSGLAQDLGEVIKRNPIPAVLIAVGVGFVVARLARG